MIGAGIIRFLEMGLIVHSGNNVAEYASIRWKPTATLYLAKLISYGEHQLEDWRK